MVIKIPEGSIFNLINIKVTLFEHFTLDKSVFTWLRGRGIWSTCKVKSFDLNILYFRRNWMIGTRQIYKEFQLKVSNLFNIKT